MDNHEAPTILSTEQLNEVTGGFVAASFPGEEPLDLPELVHVGANRKTR